MIGAHELLLIVRAQNQASAALGRVSRDIARLESRRALGTRQQAIALRQAQVSQQMLRQEQRMQSAISATGTKRLAIARQRIAIEGRSQNLNNRILNLTGRQHSIDLQRVRNANRLWDLTYKREALEKKIASHAKVAKITTDKAGRTRVAGKFAGADNEEIVTQGRMQHQLEKLNRTIDETQMAAQGLEHRQAALRRSSADLQAQIRNLDAQYAHLNAREIELIAQTSEQARQYQILTKQASLLAIQEAEVGHALDMQNWERIATAGRTVSHIGRVMQLFGLVATAAFGYAAKGAADFSTQATLAATQTGRLGSGADVIIRNSQRIGNAIRNQMKQFPSSSEDMNKAIYDIYSSTNIAFGKGLQLLKIFNQGVVAAGGPSVISLTDISGALITLANNWRLNVNNMGVWRKLMASTLATVRFGRMTVQQYTQTMNQLAPAFRGAHQPIEQLNGAIAFLTRLQPSQRFAATGLARLVEQLQRLAPSLKQNFGVNITDASGNMLNLDKVIQLLIKRFPQLKTSGTFLNNFFKLIGNSQGTIQSRRAFTALIRQNKLYQTVLKLTNGDQNEFQRSLKAMEQTTGIKWATFINQMKAIALEIGADVMPVMIKFGSILTRAVHWFDGLSPGTRRAISSFAAWGSIITLVGGALLTVTGSIVGMIAKIVLWQKAMAFERMMQNMAAVTGESASMEDGFIRVGTALKMIGIGAAIFLLIKYHDQVNKIVQALGGWHRVLMTLGVALAAFKFGQLIAGFAALQGAEAAATAETLTLRAALISLGGTAVIAALAAAAGAVYYLHKRIDKGKNNYTQDIPGKVLAVGDKGILYELNGQLYQRGANPKTGNLADMPINPHQAEMRFGDVTPAIRRTRKAIQQNIADSPRYTHAFNANQAAVDKTIAATARAERAQRARNKADSVATTITHKNVRSVQDWINAVNKAHAATLGDPKDLQKAKNYEKILGALNKRFKDQPTLLAAIQDVLQGYTSDIKDATKAGQTLGVTLQDALSGVQGMYDNLLQQNQQVFGQLFSGPSISSPFMQNQLQYGYKLTGKDLLKDIRSQVSHFNNYNRAIGNLAKKGAPAELLQQIQALGPDALPQIQALNKLSSKQLQNYFKVFQTAQQTIHNATMRQLRQQLNQYKKYGQNIALQIVAGLRSEQPALTNQLTKLVQSMFPGLPVGATGAGGKATHKPTVQHTTNNSHQITINVGSDGTSTKKQIEQAAWNAYQAMQRHRH